MYNSQQICNKVKNIEKWIIEARRYFHMYPELSEKEHNTSNKIKEYLTDMGITYEESAGTGIVAVIYGKEQGPTIGLRADIDALPILEESNAPYCSKHPGVMHGCGHDAHIAILLGAAKVLNNIKDELLGNVKLIFQPAEETIGGAKPMIEEGALKNPNVDVIFGLHVQPDLPVGKMGIKYGKMYAGSDMINISIHGKSTHGAYPHTGVDAVMVAGYVLTSLQSIVSRTIDPLNAAVISVGKISGGTAGNIVADHVHMEGTMRTLDNENRLEVRRKVKEIVENIPKSMGASGEVEIIPSYPPLINHDFIVDIVRENILSIKEDGLIVIDRPYMGVEDFAYFLEEVPGAFIALGSSNKEKGIVNDLHTHKFDIDESCLTLGVALQILNVLKAMDYIKSKN
ncbi:M20 metallopeptidase family protein [Clostridiisalibacter paucivorans]|uniref:M20 metallopeptidase family protein n=1 Tax=Clostridiisalibacter paucivorans TaxID=408753 RepID=UPI000555B008|nr:M20 family metallopeptidase [Clostridiisalibacter paucivorans]